MIVAIEGIDGAGKSHLCHLLTKRLRQHGIRVRSFDKHTAKFGDDFAGRRIALMPGCREAGAGLYPYCGPVIHT